MIKQGKTSPSDWVSNVNGGGGIYIDVNTSSAGFENTPHYLTSLEGKMHHWDVSGINAIYNPTKEGFRIYIKWIYNETKVLTPELAKEYGWSIKWTGILEVN